MNQAFLDYSLNKFLPFLIIGFLLFYNLGYEAFEPYIILGLTIFIDRFSFKTGYAVCYCDQHGIDIHNEPK